MKIRNLNGKKLFMGPGLGYVEPNEIGDCEEGRAEYYVRRRHAELVEPVVKKTTKKKTVRKRVVPSE